MDEDERHRTQEERERADEGERQTAREDERKSLNKRQTERETGKQEKQRERASGGAYYTAVTPLWCCSEWERLSTHYSSDLGGQLEESSINQTDAQAEADDSRQQCSQQTPPQPPAPSLTHTHTHTHPPINTTTSTPPTHLISPSLYICLHSCPFLYLQSFSFCYLACFLAYHPLFSLFLSVLLSRLPPLRMP